MERRLSSLTSALIISVLALTVPAHANPGRSRRSTPPMVRYAANYQAPETLPSRRASVSTAGVEDQIVLMVAQERARRGLPELTVDPYLAEAARQHSQEMDRLGYFDHYSPTSGMRSPADRLRQASDGQRRTPYVGENIYRGSYASATVAHDAFMGSSGHRENILRRSYRRIGVGVYRSRDGQVWVTQMFSD